MGSPLVVVLPGLVDEVTETELRERFSLAKTFCMLVEFVAAEIWFLRLVVSTLAPA
jgi:hypothetical protein